MGNECLERVFKVEILGVIFDERLIFDEPINYISKKLNQRIGLLSRLRHFLSEKTLIIVYNAIVLPILDYSLILFGFTYDIHMNRLIVLQKKALRVLTFSRLDASSEPIFKRLKVISLKERLVYNSLIYIFKALHSLSSINSGNYFRNKTKRSSVRNENKFQLDIPSTRLTVFKNTIFVKGVELYNAIDVKFRSVKKFVRIC
jgi:hypothetical protein